MPVLCDAPYSELADLEADEYVDGAIEIWTRGLLIRRHVASDDLGLLHDLVPGRHDH